MSRPHSSPPSFDASPRPEDRPMTAAPEMAMPDMATIVITADHVYLPLDERGEGLLDWPVSNNSTVRVERRTRLKVPADLALFLSARDQAEIVT